MLSDVFYWVLNVSILGSLTGTVVLLLRAWKPLPRFAVYLLWALPFFRFWVPFGFANEYSLLTLLSRVSAKTVVVWEERMVFPAFPETTASNFMGAATSYFPVKYKTDLLEGVFHVASLVWVIIAAGAVLTAIALYALTKSELRSAEHIGGNLYKSDRIASPAVYGVFRPKIILPTGLTEGDVQYIVMHEQVHIRRRDNLWRMAAVLTACMHWFNPLAWMLLKYFFADMEFACDARVIKRLDEARKTEYASAVLSAAQGKAFFASAFGGAKTRVRIENILSYKKLTLFSALFFTALIAVVTIILLTNAVG